MWCQHYDSADELSVFLVLVSISLRLHKYHTIFYCLIFHVPPES